MKKLLSFSLACLMVLILCSCGNKNIQSDIVEIEFFQQNEAEVEIFEKIISDFEQKYTNIKVTQVNLPEEESANVLNTRIQNNDSPDIYNEWFSQDAFNKIDLGAVRDMTDSSLLSYVNEGVLEQTSYNGKNYLIPISTNFMGIYYNVNIFDKYGLTVPETMDELWDVCETLQNNGITPISAGDMDGWNLAHWAQDVMGLTFTDYSEDFLKVFNGEISGAEIKGISEFADVIVTRSKYVQKDCLGYDTDSMISLFVNQEAAMMFNGSWQMARLNAADLDFEYKIVPFPAMNKESTLVQSNADFSFMLSSQSTPEKQEAAEKFLEYILEEGAQYYLDQTGSPSALKNMSADASVYQDVVPYLTEGKTFRMPYSGRWTDDTYLDYTVALQNLVSTGDKEVFYREFEKSLTVSGQPQTYIK